MKIHKSIRQMPWPEPYRAGQQDFRVTFSWPVIDHERLLVATFVCNRDKQRWRNPGPDFRLVASKKQQRCRILYQGEAQSKRHDLNDALYRLGARAATSYPEISQTDEIALAKWLGRRGTNNHLMPELASWVTDVVEAEKQAERDARGELRDEDVDLCPEALPGGLVDFIRDTVLPEDDVLIYKKGNVRGLCYQCRQEVRAAAGQRFKSDYITTCPNCGSRVVAYLHGSDRFKAQYVQNIATLQMGTDGKTVFIRQWHLCRDPKAKWNDIPGQLEEIGRYAIRGNRVAKWVHERKDNWWGSNSRYCTNYWERCTRVTEVYDGVYYFAVPQNWREIVAGTSLQYCDLTWCDCNAPGGKQVNDSIRFLMDWARYPAVEKLWKAGYTGLVNAKMFGHGMRKCRIRWSANTIEEALGIPQRFLKRMKPRKWDVQLIERYRKAYALSTSGRIRDDEVLLLVNSDVGIDYLDHAFGHAPVEKILRYLKDARCSTYTYRDYLQECTQLGLNLDDKQVLFPKDLRAAHDRTMKQVKYKANKEKKAAFIKAAAKLEDLAWEADGLLIRPAQTPQELTDEGAYLHHCVGGYVDRMSKGETAILLIRKAEEPNTPYYTLEWRGQRVIQCRTSHNKSYEQDEAIHAFVQAWIKHITKNSRKKKPAAKAS